MLFCDQLHAERTVRIGLFVATFAGLLTILAIGVPLPYGPETVAGGAPPAANSPDQCFRLEYTYERDEPLPSYIQLSAVVVRGASGWWQAEGGPEQGLHRDARWRPAGKDSLDFTWHHGWVFRLSNRGLVRGGRMTPSYSVPLFWWPIFRDYPLVAYAIDCREYPALAT